jgi:hypothetical protein
MLQSEAGYIDARPLTATSTKTLATHGRTIHCAISGLMHRNMIGAKRKTASRRSLRNAITYIDQATSLAFRILRQPSRPKAPRPLAKSGNVAGKGVSRGGNTRSGASGPSAPAVSV